jgi:two-component system LytT family response regulator
MSTDLLQLRVVVVDDEALARERLRRLLDTEDRVEIVAECASGAEALQAVQEHKPNLLLLDIQMPGMDGFEVLRALTLRPAPAVVFVTAFDQHAVRAFEARALDYLLKPASRARLRETLGRAREHLAVNPGRGLPQPLLDLLAEREAAAAQIRRLAVKSGERMIFIPVEEIDWLEAAGNYVVLHVRKETHILRDTMGSLETQLPADFVRVSRSAIVNLRRVKEIQAVSPGEHVAILTDGQRVAMTRSLREVEERLRFG